jgi:2-polyprenyl-6-methoxyphenol hydroxylase-like FAD-dependent oxidoreductase
MTATKRPGALGQSARAGGNAVLSRALSPYHRLRAAASHHYQLRSRVLRRSVGSNLTVTRVEVHHG